MTLKRKELHTCLIWFKFNANKFMLHFTYEKKNDEDC